MATATDPICLMQVDTENPNGGTSEFEGQTYYFCAPRLPHRVRARPGGLGFGPQQACHDGRTAAATVDVRAPPVPARLGVGPAAALVLASAAARAARVASNFPAGARRDGGATGGDGSHGADRGALGGPPARLGLGVRFGGGPLRRRFGG